MTLNAKTWFARLAPFRSAHNGRASVEIAITLIPFFALWAGMCALIGAGQYWALIGTIPAGGLVVRLFIVQHDCGHNSFFSSRRANDWTGRVLSVFTLTPYDHWKRNHALHHAVSGNLDRRGVGDDIITLTVDEYEALGRIGRIKYRLYRHPLVMFGIGPAFVFLLQHRLPWGEEKKRAMHWTSTLATNAGMAALYGLLIYLVGWKAVLLIQIPTIIIGASIGVWMFYVQHQFEGTHWERNSAWSRESAALHGSSYYDLPAPLMWITGHIGVHHVHHLSARIPFYRLTAALKAYPELKNIARLTLWESVKCVKLTLWCEQTRQMVSFAGRRRVGV